MSTEATKQYLEGRIDYLQTTHNQCLKELDELKSGIMRDMKWKLINELHSRYTELQEALKVLNGEKSIFGHYEETPVNTPA